MPVGGFPSTYAEQAEYMKRFVPKAQPAPGPAPAAPAAPAAAAPPAPPGAAAGSFDYSSNPYYQQVLAAVNAGGAADAANTRAAIQQALIGFGFVPGGFKDRLGALDDVTRSLIEKNTKTGISGYARLLEGRDEGIKGLVRDLTSRGMLRSGSKGYRLRKNQLGFDRNFADALSGLLGGVNQQYGAYAQNEFARQQQLANAMAWVYQNFFTPSQGVGTPTAEPSRAAAGFGTPTPTGQTASDWGGSYDVYDFGNGRLGY